MTKKKRWIKEREKRNKAEIFEAKFLPEMGQKSLIYAFVARGTLILAEYTEFSGNFNSIAFQCLQKLPATSNKFTYNCDAHTFTYLLDNGYSESLFLSFPFSFGFGCGCGCGFCFLIKHGTVNCFGFGKDGRMDMGVVLFGLGLRFFDWV